MLNTKFSPWPNFTEEEAEAVKNVLLSNKVNYWTGDEGRKFETEFANFAETKYAIALANGSVALELALMALNIGAGDEVIVTSRTFLASASCIVNIGATPIFADVDKDSQNITAESIKMKISSKTKAIICVHLAGWPCDMSPIMSLTKEHNLSVIEDCAQAHGTKYNNQSVGSFGDIGIWSFCQDKIITTAGEGGMVTTNNKLLWEKMWAYKDHGKSWEAVYETEHPPGYRWLHDSFGNNYRMTEMQSAVGRIQLKRLPAWLKTRNNHAETLSQTCRKFNCFRVPILPENITHAFYKLYIFVEPEQLKEGWTRDRIMDEINTLGVPCLSGSCSEIYLEKAFDDTGFRPKERLPVAQLLGETSLMFLVHPSLSDSEVKIFCEAIDSVATQVCS
jgi:dTDP-4-amino-4,6-dideoxygalactose transaminase